MLTKVRRSNDTTFLSNSGRPRPVTGNSTAYTGVLYLLSYSRLRYNQRLSPRVCIDDNWRAAYHIKNREK